LIHHAMTIHRADGNRSKNRTRQALGFIFYSALAKEDQSTLKTYEKALHQDLAAAGKI
jgi:phytanoyl-CoA hydroxylase